MVPHTPDMRKPPARQSPGSLLKDPEKVSLRPSIRHTDSSCHYAVSCHRVGEDVILLVRRGVTEVSGIAAVCRHLESRR